MAESETDKVADRGPDPPGDAEPANPTQSDVRLQMSGVREGHRVLDLAGFDLDTYRWGEE